MDEGKYTRMRPTFFDVRKFWRRRGRSWVCTEQGRSALKRVKERRKRRYEDAKKWHLMKPQPAGTHKMVSLREDVRLNAWQ